MQQAYADAHLTTVHMYCIVGRHVLCIVQMQEMLGPAVQQLFLRAALDMCQIRCMYMWHTATRWHLYAELKA